MADSIYKKLLKKYTLEELKDKVPAGKSLETVVQSLSALSAQTPDSPKKDLSVPAPRVIDGDTLYGLFHLLFWPTIVITMVYFQKYDPQYKFDGYVNMYEHNVNVGKDKVRFYETFLQNTDRIEVEEEDGTKIIYFSPWYDDNKIDEVVSIKPTGERIILCDDGACLKEATRVAADYKIKILNEKEKQFKGQLKK